MRTDSPYTLTDWLDYLESRHSQPIQLGLDRVKTVALSLGLIALDAVVITVAGTNGKGSTVAALEAIYSTAGYHVGSYTSPHILAFNERIRLNQQPVLDEVLCAAFRSLDAIETSADLTYFEMTTLAAFLIFKTQALDVIILEVGMGGRLDATNIIDANLAIITTIDLDHQAWLGETREAIGYEKAGILRAGRPAIYADDNPPASVLAYAEILGVRLVCYQTDYKIQAAETGDVAVVLGTGEKILFPRPRLHLKAAAAALVATKLLQKKLPVSFTHCSDAMNNVTIQGRQQIVDGRVKTILDVAHNPQAVRLLVDFIERHVVGEFFGTVHAVFSGLKDKDLCGLIKPMQSVVDYWYPALLQGARAADEALLRVAFSDANVVCSVCYNNPLAAYNAAMDTAQPGDWVVVYGSFLTVSAVIATDMIQA